MQVLQPQDPLTTSFLAEFQRCREWIKNALKFAHHSHSPEDVLIMCQKGDADLSQKITIFLQILDYLRFFTALD